VPGVAEAFGMGAGVTVIVAVPCGAIVSVVGEKESE
jgi:hypothetical protein